MARLTAASKAYKAIFTDPEPVRPFVDFYAEVGTAVPLLRQLEGISFQYQDVLRAIKEARAWPLDRNGHAVGPYFRGSGIIAVGDTDGLKGVNYQRNSWWPEEPNDPVADRYSLYQGAVYRGLGNAALALRFSKSVSSPVHAYQEVNKVLQGQDLLADPQTPHHLGYAYNRSGSVAAAAGMLPSPLTRSLQDELFSGNIPNSSPQAIQSGQLEWWGDEFIGYYDLVAATLALGNDPLVCDQFLTAPGVNLHLRGTALR